MIVKELFPGYIQYLKDKGRSDSTLSERTHLLEAVIEHAVGDIDLRILQEFDSALVEREARKRGPSAPCRSIVTFRQLLKYAVKSGYKLNFDWRDIEVPKLAQKPVYFFSKEEIETIRNAFDWKYARDRRQHALFELTIHTGLRLFEALKIDRFKDIDWINEEIEIVGKGGKIRKVYIHGCSDILRKYLATRTDDHPVLFMSRNGNPLSKNTAKSYMRHFKKRLKIQNLDFTFISRMGYHIGRKTFAMILLKSKKLTLKEVQMLGGWQSERTLLKYYAAAQQEDCKKLHKEVMEKV